jgi:hypothetical protein
MGAYGGPHIKLYKKRAGDRYYSLLPFRINAIYVKSKTNKQGAT